MPSLDPQSRSLGYAIFQDANFGDRRRSARLAQTLDAMQRHPGGTLPDKLYSPPDLRAFYRLCDSPEITHAAIIEAVRNYTLDQMAARPGPILVLHDATELDYATLASLSDDLGQIGKGTRRGYICHNVLAVDAESGDVIGLLDQILHCRDEVPKNEPVNERRERETRESLLWLHGTRHLPGDRQLVDVSDQGSDTFEFLEHQAHSGRRFIVRACRVRKITPGHEPNGARQYIKEHARRLPELGRFTMDVQSQPGRKARKNAEFTVRGGALLVHPPHAKYGQHGDEPLPLYVVEVAEVKPPKGQKRITWVLLTNEPVHNYDDACRVSGWYERRWIIEEFHKAQKTGCQIEDLQFTSTDRLQPAIAMLSVVALTLLSLRDASRRADKADRPATDVIARDYIDVLSRWRHKRKKIMTVRQFFLALARLGGHQNRKSDHRPGWLILWRGWTKLQLLQEGYAAARAG